MTYTVTLIPGDGIGPEVSAAAVRVLTATGVAFEFETENAGAEAMGREGVALPAARPGVDPPEQARPEGPDGHAGRAPAIAR